MLSGKNKRKKKCWALACLALNINVVWQKKILKKKKKCWTLACLALNINVVWQKNNNIKKKKKKQCWTLMV
jgi:hypothetical protein